MVGALVGFVLFLIIALCGGISFWWLLWGSLAGGFTEVITRLGFGEPLGEIIGAISDLLGAFFECLSCFKGGDSGGSSD